MATGSFRAETSGNIVCNGKSFRKLGRQEEFCASWSCRGLKYTDPNVRLLALDPALRNCGYAILEKEGSKLRAVNYGVIRNKAQLSMPGCLVEIHRQIEELILAYRPKSAQSKG